MKTGAVDFLVKPFREQDMLDAVAAAVERGNVVLENTVSVELRARYESLTKRERNHVTCHIRASQ
jgi:FixJ family two-component response regulator